MAELYGVEAAEGDCLLLSWTQNEKRRWILIDGGPSGTFKRSLRPSLEKLAVAELELIVNSHVDADHVAGLLELFSEAIHGTTAPAMSELWHNQFSKTVDANGAIRGKLAALSSLPGAAPASFAAAGNEAFQSIGQGSKLVDLAEQANVSLNASNDGDPWLVDPKPTELRLAGGLKLCVVGPTKANLGELKKEWQAFVAKAAAQPAAMVDGSVPNLSSIQLLLEHGDQRMLLTGDGRGDHLLEGLETQALLDDQGGIDVDILKVPHHGSDRNVDEAFFRKVRAKQYLISADGKHGNPDADTLKWILAGAKADKRAIEIFFTNEPPQVTKFANSLSSSDRCKVRIRDASSRFIAVD